MSLIAPLLLAIVSTLVYGQSSCYNARLGIVHCQQCGSPGLDDFCVKRYGACGNYVAGTFGPYGLNGGPNGLPPQGYLSQTTPPNVPATCNTLINTTNAIPNRNLNNGVVPVYATSGWSMKWGGNSVPRVFINPQVTALLRVDNPQNPHQCLENNVPKYPRGPNGVWNTFYMATGNRVQKRLDSFFFDDNGNNTWSYQCYCDFCYSCMGCNPFGPADVLIAIEGLL